MNARRSDGDGAQGDPAELLRAIAVPITAATMERALTHRSYAYENGGLPTNERLEFLGDSVLSLVVTDTLYNGHPDLPEGQLAKLRAAVVQMNTLAEVARELNLGSFVRLGRGEEGTGGRDKPSILADTLEAVIGATYIDCGLDAASGLVHRLFDPVIQRSSLLGAGLDWKTSLQELTADRGLGVPEYVVKDSGPDHQKLFRAVVRVGSRELGSGEGRSKKAAEQLAAEAAYRSITAEKEKIEQPDPERPPPPPAPSPSNGVAPQDSAAPGPATGAAAAEGTRTPGTPTQGSPAPEAPPQARSGPASSVNDAGDPGKSPQGGSAPGGSAQDPAGPGTASQGEATPETATQGSPVPGTATQGAGNPGPATQDTGTGPVTPDTAVQDTAIEGAPVPGTATEGAALPDTGHPKAPRDVIPPQPTAPRQPPDAVPPTDA